VSRIRPVDEPSLLDVGPTGGALGPCLVWRLATPMLAISSSILGGGIGHVSWVLNVTVDRDYSRLDPADHLAEMAAGLDLAGRGIGLMTAVDVSEWTAAECDDATVHATVGINRPVWAADVNRSPGFSATDPGTINVVATVPVRLSDAALVNAVATITEAKAQALAEHHVAGTGTASDAVCVLCPIEGDPEPFGGPRSLWGGRLAQAAYDAITAGIVRRRV